MIVNVFPPKRSLKNLVINVLIQNDLKTEEIRKRVKKEYSVSVTYQGVNKILHMLKEEGVVLNKDNCWRINEKWIKSLSSVINICSKRDEVPVYSPEMKSISFDTMDKALKFIFSNIQSDRLRNNGDKIFITHVKNIGFFNLDKNEMDFLKKFTKSTECHVIMEGKSLINRLVGKYLKSFGANVHIGVPRSTPYTVTVYGNTVYNTYSTFNLTAYMTEAYESIKKITDLKAAKLFTSLKDDARIPIKFTFETDREIVEMTKKYLLMIAKGKKI